MGKKKLVSNEEQKLLPESKEIMKYLKQQQTVLFLAYILILAMAAGAWWLISKACISSLEEIYFKKKGKYLPESSQQMLTGGSVSLAVIFFSLRCYVYIFFFNFLL